MNQQHLERFEFTGQSPLNRVHLEKGCQDIQLFVNALSRAPADLIREQGGKAEVPTVPERFHTVSEPDGSGLSFTSNWSERHVAYACSLGTFGLSKGIITEKGMAGRLGSVVTNIPFAPTPRAYTQVYGYCTGCGLCQTNMPCERRRPVKEK